VNKIKTRLKELGKSQTWLAIETKLALPFINSIVKDKILAPKISTGLKISHALGVSIESLWSFEEKKDVNKSEPGKP